MPWNPMEKPILYTNIDKVTIGFPLDKPCSRYQFVILAGFLPAEILSCRQNCPFGSGCAPCKRSKNHKHLPIRSPLPAFPYPSASAG